MKRIVGLVLVVFCLCSAIALATPTGESHNKDWVNQGQQYIVAKEYQKAIDLFTKVITDTPEESVAYNKRGITYMILRQWDQAIQDFWSL